MSEKKKSKIWQFRVDKQTEDFLNSIPNASEFIRDAVKAKINATVITDSENASLAKIERVKLLQEKRAKLTEKMNELSSKKPEHTQEKLTEFKAKTGIDVTYYPDGFFGRAVNDETDELKPREPALFLDRIYKFGECNFNAGECPIIGFSIDELERFIAEKCQIAVEHDAIRIPAEYEEIISEIVQKMIDAWELNNKEISAYKEQIAKLDTEITALKERF